MNDKDDTVVPRLEPDVSSLSVTEQLLRMFRDREYDRNGDLIQPRVTHVCNALGWHDQCLGKVTPPSKYTTPDEWLRIVHGEYLPCECPCHPVFVEP
jgi:hypothetical protein